MSGIDDQGMRPDGVDLPEVPAGRAGADSGAADAVRIDSDDESEVPDSSSMNDEPGVGPRRARR